MHAMNGSTITSKQIYYENDCYSTQFVIFSKWKKPAACSCTRSHRCHSDTWIGYRSFRSLLLHKERNNPNGCEWPARPACRHGEAFSFVGKMHPFYGISRQDCRYKSYTHTYTLRYDFMSNSFCCNFVKMRYFSDNGIFVEKSLLFVMKLSIRWSGSGVLGLCKVTNSG